MGPAHNNFPIEKTCIAKERKLSFNTSSGVVIITEEAFSKNLNAGRPFEIIEQAEEYKSYGVYITDVAMRWLKRDHVTYLGVKKSASYPSKDYVHGAYINGVVKTDLEDRFPEFKDYLYKDVLTADEYKALTKHPNFDKFLRTFARYATYYYSFNKNFLEDYKNVRKDFRWFTNYEVILEATKKYSDSLNDISDSSVIKRGTFYLSKENDIPKGYCNVSLGLLNTYMNEEAS